jgi:hypothetical protein
VKEFGRDLTKALRWIFSNKGIVTIDRTRLVQVPQKRLYFVHTNRGVPSPSQADLGSWDYTDVTGAAVHRPLLLQ